MKSLTFTLLLAIVSITVFGQSKAGSPIGPVPYRAPEETIGMDYFVQPLEGIFLKYGYTGLRKRGHEYDNIKTDLSGKILKLVSIDTRAKKGYLKDEQNEEYETLFDGLSLADVSLLSDLEYAKKNFLNKPLWMHIDDFFAGTDDSNKSKIEGALLDKVTVIDIIPSDVSTLPLRFVLKTQKGEVGKVLTSVSGTNTRLERRDWFNNIFFIKDPKLTYNFTPEVWKIVKSGNPKIGMPIDAFKLIMGLPTHMYTTTTVNGASQQWIYGDTYPSYYLFERGKLVAMHR